MAKEINFNKMPSIYWSEKQKMEWLERYIIIHSILYYELDTNIIPDKQFDCVSKQLLKMSKENNIDFKQTKYYYVFKDFDANTGFYIYDRLNKKDKQYLTNVSNIVLKTHNGGKTNAY